MQILHKFKLRHIEQSIFLKEMEIIMYFLEEIHSRTAELLENIRLKLYTYRKKEDFRSSLAWEFFHVISDESGNDVDQFFYCIKCGQIKYIRSEGSTTQLLRHECIVAYINATAESSTKIDANFIQKLNIAAAKFVCLDLRPMNALEGYGVREIFRAGIELGKCYPKVKTANLAAHFPSRKSAKTIIATEAEIAKERIKIIFKSAILKGGFGCTLDLWSDKYKHNSYMGMTANVYISTDECIELKRIVFNMQNITEIVKSRELIKSKILGVFKDFGVNRNEIKNFITFTTDR